jgi:pimeloyl-ACP methyl ester carboxylesterase
MSDSIGTDAIRKLWCHEIFLSFGHLLRKTIPIIGIATGLSCSPQSPVLPTRSTGGPFLALERCSIADLPDAKCGTYRVFEDRGHQRGREIALNVVVVTATKHVPDMAPIFWLDGGPGGAASDAAGYVSLNWLHGLHRDHDFVFVDERGAGKSGPLRCGEIGEDPKHADAFFGKPFPPELLLACRNELEKVADLRFYTTALFIGDLNDVCQALGYNQISFAALSYGTLAAQAYMRRYPDQVRSAFLFGLVTPEYKLPLPFAETSQRALDQLWRDCSADRRCHRAFPDVGHEFDEVLERFGDGVIAAQMIDPSTRRERVIQLTRESYLEDVREMLYSTTSARFLPFIVHQAYKGNFVPFGVGAARFPRGGAGPYAGLHFSTLCSEAIPFINPEELAEATRETFLGESRVKSYSDVCKEWPRGDVPRSFLQPVETAVPILVFSGEEDGVTPPWLVDKDIMRWPNARHVKIPHSGHQLDTPCEFNIVEAFFRAGSAKNLDTSCVEKTQRPPFAISIAQQ